MFELISIYLAYRNGVRAKAKGQNPLLFAIATIAGILFCMVVGGSFVAFSFCNDAIKLDWLTSFDREQRLAAAHQLQQALTGDIFHLITIQLIAMSGYFIIRYLLEKEEDKKQPKINWLNKIKE